jgi:hypothetical protein
MLYYNVYVICKIAIKLRYVNQCEQMKELVKRITLALNINDVLISQFIV